MEAGQTDTVVETAPPEPTEEVEPEPTVNPADVSMVGDSVMLGAYNALQDALPGCTVDAKVSRQLWDAYGVLDALESGGQLGSIVEGKSADFAMFSVDPTTSTTPEDFDALRADMTVLAGIPVYDSSSSQTPKDWYEEFSSQVEQVFGELSFEEGEE